MRSLKRDPHGLSVSVELIQMAEQFRLSFVKDFSMVHTESASDSRNISQAAGVVGFFTILSRILGLVRDMVVAGFFGTGMAADAFFVALRIPNLLRRLFAEGSLTIAFVPVFTETLHQRTKADAFQLARAALTLLSVILATVTVLGILFSPWLVRIQAFGFGASGDKFELAVLLTRITFPYIFFISLVALFMGILNSLRHFAAPAAAPIFLNLGIIGAAFLISPELEQPIVGLAIGVIIGGCLQLGLQIPWAIKKGMSLLPCWMPGHPAIKKIGRLMIPAVFGSAVYQLNAFIITLLASFLSEGSISWLYYADRLVQFPLGVFAIAVSTAALPAFSTQLSRGQFQAFHSSLNHALRLVIFITIPATVGLIVLGPLIIRLFFQRGAFDAHSTAMTYEALLFYAIGLLAFSGIRVLVSGFYAFQDTKTPVKIAFVALLANLLLGLILMRPLNHGGLALALSLASMVQVGLLIFFLKRRIRDWNLGPVFVTALKSLILSLAMGGIVYYLRVGWWISEPGAGLGAAIFNLARLVAAGIVIYLAGAFFVRCRELQAVVDMFGLRKRKDP